jgi:hypothetical protein
MKGEFWSEQFEVKGESPSSWALQARRLTRAADLVFEAYRSDLRRMQEGCSPLDLGNLETVGPATLLYGLAFENLFKAIILTKESAVIEDGRLKKWPGSGHGLVGLAERAEIQLTTTQRDLLSRLTAFVEWSGRYPIPMSDEKMRLKQDAVSPEWFPLPIQPHELATVHQFLEELDARILA